MSKNHNTAAIGAIFTGAAIALGALAAHALEKRISLHYLEVFKTGAQYQMYSGLGLLALDLWSGFSQQVKKAANLIIAGTLIFSLSLYILALNEILGEGLRKLGMITPIGGVLMIAGWFWLAWLLLKKEREQ